MIRDPRGGHNRKKVNEDFFKTWSPRMAYVLGFMYADGSLLNTNESSRTFYALFSNNDLPLLESIRRSIGSNHLIYSRPPHVMSVRNKKYISKTGYLLRIGNKIIYQDLIALGMQHRKSNIMVLPDIPREYLSFFVRGYFDGDGCISWYYANGRNYPSLRVLFSSGSTKFLSDLSDVLSKILGLSVPSSYIYDNLGASNLVYQGSRAMSVLDYIYSNLNRAPFLKYKHRKYLDYRNNLMGPRVKKVLGIN